MVITFAKYLLITIVGSNLSARASGVAATRTRRRPADLILRITYFITSKKIEVDLFSFFQKGLQQSPAPK
jgi:hypothetical protein